MGMLGGLGNSPSPAGAKLSRQDRKYLNTMEQSTVLSVLTWPPGVWALRLNFGSKPSRITAPNCSVGLTRAQPASPTKNGPPSSEIGDDDLARESEEREAARQSRGKEGKRRLFLGCLLSQSTAGWLFFGLGRVSSLVDHLLNLPSSTSFGVQFERFPKPWYWDGRTWRPG